MALGAFKAAMGAAKKGDLSKSVLGRVNSFLTKASFRSVNALKTAVRKMGVSDVDPKNLVGSLEATGLGKMFRQSANITRHVAQAIKNRTRRGRATGLKPSALGLRSRTRVGKTVEYTGAQTMIQGMQLGRTLGNVGVGMAGFALKHPKTTLSVISTAGLIHGTASSSINNLRTRSESKRMTGRHSMRGDHLGTDGLTLALSRARHR